MHVNTINMYNYIDGGTVNPKNTDLNDKKTYHLLSP